MSPDGVVGISTTSLRKTIYDADGKLSIESRFPKIFSHSRLGWAAHGLCR